MKRLAEWSGYQLALAWLIGLLIQQAALFVAGFRVSWPERHGALLVPVPVEEASISQARRDSLLAFMYVYVRDHLHGADGVIWPDAEKDSLFRAWGIPARLSPMQKDSLRRAAATLVEPLAGPIVQGLERAGRAVVLGTLLFLTPLLALVVLTG